MLKKVFLLFLAVVLALGTVPALAAERYTASTPLSGSGSEKLHNLALAAQAIDGTEIPYGGRFSFNETVGPRTSGRGYQTAPNGRGAMVTGGGVAQAASTLYLALKAAGDAVKTDPVKTYGSRFTDTYVDDPENAVVTDYDAGIDLSFTNRTDTLTIEMWMDDHYIYCALVSGEEASADNGGWFVDAPFAPAGTVAPARRLAASASLTCTPDADALTNIALAADSISDTTLNSGDAFSFNDIVGPRSKEYGYVRAVNGRGKRVVGGGVAQVASALWLSIKDDASFAIVEKSTYGGKYNQGYVASSADAILTDYASGRDFSFRYTGPGSVTIYTYVTDGVLYCDIYGN